MVLHNSSYEIQIIPYINFVEFRSGNYFDQIHDPKKND